jgi:hypothetical protein
MSAIYDYISQIILFGVGTVIGYVTKYIINKYILQKFELETQRTKNSLDRYEAAYKTYIPVYDLTCKLSIYLKAYDKSLSIDIIDGCIYNCIEEILMTLNKNLPVLLQSAKDMNEETKKHKDIENNSQLNIKEYVYMFNAILIDKKLGTQDVILKASDDLYKFIECFNKDFKVLENKYNDIMAYKIFSLDRETSLTLKQQKKEQVNKISEDIDSAVKNIQNNSGVNTIKRHDAFNKMMTSVTILK